MKKLVLIFTLFYLNACSKAPSRVEIVISEENSITLNGSMVDNLNSFRDEIRKIRREFGDLPVWITTSGEVTVIDFQNVALVTREERLGNIYSVSRIGEDSVLYPIMSPWTNEWKWHSFFDNESEHIRIHPDAGTNVRLLPDGVLIETEVRSINEINEHFKSLSGGDRARVVLSADPKARHEDLIYILKLCREYSIDPIYIKDWIQYIIR
ncbi:MAG: hypothetical protein JJU05_06100 [Verrucomicrobia bacterium]|nr:hypothetical protein [Verrucomicrobiota bacterium]MCH8525787.1 hypothetical protein [Kiritimatiellia bacterium]